jgi:hypothetical protein
MMLTCIRHARHARPFRSTESLTRTRIDGCWWRVNARDRELCAAGQDWTATGTTAAGRVSLPTSSR